MREKLKLLPIIAVLSMTGCATVPSPPTYRDVEPALVGKPVAERINEAEQTIHSQFQLLSQLESGQRIGSYDVVKHNNDLETRIGSPETIPQAYAQGLQNRVPSIPVPQAPNSQAASVNAEGLPVGTLRQVGGEALPAVAVPVSSPEQVTQPQLSTVNPTSQKVKKIEWTDNSLNKLAENISKAIGYELVIKGGLVADKNINFVAENQTLSEVIEKLKKETTSFANIVVIEQNRTFNIFYK